MMNAPQTIRLDQPENFESIFNDSVRQRSVMVVDDSPCVRAVVEASLQRENVAVTTYADGLMALGALQRQEVDIPDVVLIDIELPKMDGYELAKILHAKPEMAESALVMLSGHDGMIDKMRARLAGAQGFIAKPFDVRFMVRQVLSYFRPAAVM